ncbi:NAD(P)H-dependent flavin oxidoreductase [Spirosoma sp. KUDC1026]|uniref:NAD(P)H-dependent flavin oxidoreductase n=1 Tax=Spirosoma sp. KUDC1026 TaxID=2745947 RepID=UPI00159BA123|nr:nitronate monooxygenase [Spirosoma sp. KUDC1026]QKZ13767.1 nitronate monooxygenase [Spirosoma sp. KUDC1026]
MKLTTQLAIAYPILQGPMLGVTTPAMVAAVANAGGLGSLPVGGLSPEKTHELILATKSKTDKPFAVNLFAHETSVSTSQADIDTMLNLLEAIYEDYGIPFSRPALTEFNFYSYQDQIEVLLHEQIPIVSFTFGLLEPAVVDQLKQQGSTLIGTATCVREAILLEESGVDIVVAQGVEAGGHRGTFLTDGPLPQVGSLSLLPQIVDAVSLPVIAAGGLFDARTVKAAFVLGAEGVQLGSFFLASDESAASEAYKTAVLSASDTSTALTRAFSGRWARGITNRFMEQVEQATLTIPYYTYQNSLTAGLRAYAQQNNIPELISLWAGQSASNSRRGKASDLLRSLIEQLDFDQEPV